MQIFDQQETPLILVKIKKRQKMALLKADKQFNGFNEALDMGLSLQQIGPI